MFCLDDVPARSGEQARCVAMPLGGVGTGTVAVAGNGALRQWQLHNVGRHDAHVPLSFLAMRLNGVPGDPIRLLQGPPLADAADARSISDGRVPAGERALTDVIAPMQQAHFRGIYPVARVDLEDEAIPLQVAVEHWNPFAPHELDDSSVPALLSTVRLANPTDRVFTGWVAGSALNAVGWDGVSEIVGNASSPLGGNVNRHRRRGRQHSIVMSGVEQATDHPGWGQMVLSTDAPGVHTLEQGVGAHDVRRFLEGAYTIDHHEDVVTRARLAGSDGRGGISSGRGPSPAGSTWLGALAVPFRLAPGEQVELRFWLTWWFPNRYVNFVQFGRKRDYGRSKLWLGNAYAVRYPDAVATADDIGERWDDLALLTEPWVKQFADGQSDPALAERIAAQPAYLRSTSCFIGEDGRFYGFEGVQGASTGGWADDGGSCPLNCTHVWNYVQLVSRVMPQLERNMRNTEFDVLQAPEGYLPHRLVAPSFVRQLWDEPIGGPVDPAVDGMLGLILKSLREVQRGESVDWLRRRWPRLLALLAHVRSTWDPDGTGVLRGAQPSTFDIDLHGVNPYIGTYWLAALRAMSVMASMVEDEDTRAEVDDLFERGSVSYDELMWTGEYFRQVLAPEDTRDYSWGEGCLADQLVGQWWANQLGLGYVLPRDHVRTALRSIMRYNYRDGFADHHHQQRVFADGDERGVLNCTWPHGGRPDHPVYYCDEVWTGVEHTLTAMLAFESMHDEAELVAAAVHGRYDGRRRNPYNEVECGDHYVRAMSAITVAELGGRVRMSATTETVELRTTTPSLLFGPHGWAAVEPTETGVRVAVLGGTMQIGSVVVDASNDTDTASVAVNMAPVQTSISTHERGRLLALDEAASLSAGDTLDVSMAQ